MNQEFSANTTLSHYHIVKQIDTGGMGESGTNAAEGDENYEAKK